MADQIDVSDTITKAQNLIAAVRCALSDQSIFDLQSREINGLQEILYSAMDDLEEAKTSLS